MAIEEGLQKLLDQALNDEAFRARLFDNPSQAARDAGYDLTAEQLATLKTIDMQTIAERLDVRPVRENGAAHHEIGAPPGESRMSGGRFSIGERAKRFVSQRTTWVPTRKQRLAFALAAVVLAACLVVLLSPNRQQGELPLAATAMGGIRLDVALAFVAGLVLGGLVFGLWPRLQQKWDSKDPT